MRRPEGVVRLLLRDAAHDFEEAARLARQTRWRRFPQEEAQQRAPEWEGRAIALRALFTREFGEMSLIAEGWLELPKIVLAGLR